MSNTLHSNLEKIKSNIRGTAEISKETIKEIMASNSKFLSTAMDSNKKIVDSIKEKLYQQELEDSITDTIKTSFGKSIQLSEGSLDSIINSYTRHMEMNADFNTKLVDVINDSSIGNSEKVLELILENFEASRQLTIENTKEILNFYNKHTNLAIDLNHKFGENIKTQIETFSGKQDKSLNKFTNLAVEWWK